MEVGNNDPISPTHRLVLRNKEMEGHVLQRPKPKKPVRCKETRAGFLSLVRRQDEYLLYGLPGLCQGFWVRDMGKQAQGVPVVSWVTVRLSLGTSTGQAVR